MSEIEEADRLAGAPHPRETKILCGHDDVERRLLAAWQSARFPHALLIGGPEGIGKATLAYRLARFVLAGGQASDPSTLAIGPDHPVSRQIEAQAHPDLLVVRRAWNEDTKKLRTEIRVEDVRRTVSFFGSTSAYGGYRVCIVDSADELNRAGANALLKVLEERLGTALGALFPVATAGSIGKHVHFRGRAVPVIGMEEALAAKPDIALFSAGGGTSLAWAPKFAEAGTIVIDNSSAWRMDPDKLLIVPEINGHLLGDADFSQGGIIANPNCSTIQLVMALAPLHREFKVERVVVSTYQSVTGTGQKAVDQMESERRGEEGGKVYPFPIDRNVIPRCDLFLENGYTKEEMKVVKETQKILDPAIRVTCTAVRVPVTGGHSESVNVEFAKDFDLDQVRSTLREAPGIELADDPSNDIYPMPLHAHDRDEVFVGRLRRDESQPRTLNMWIVADNLRKGAATNAVQIAELLLSEGWLSAQVQRADLQ